MKKIITAINSPEINKKLKEEKKFEIIGKDVQYREAILEILEKRNDINIIIIYEKILGKINIEDLINKIKKINLNIEIIFFLEKENAEKRKILNNKNIKKIYIKNKLNSQNLIKLINNEKIENKIFTKINKIKKIINKYFYEKNNINNKDKIDNKNSVNNRSKKFNIIKNKIRKIIRISKIKNKDKNKVNITNKFKNLNKKLNVNNIKNNSKNNIKINSKKINKSNNINKNKKNKIITIVGENNFGKNMLILFFIKYLEKRNKKILIINFDKNNKKLLDEKIYFNKNRKNKLEKKRNKLNKIENKKIIYNKIKNKKEIKKYIKKLEYKINENIIYIFGLDFILKNIDKESKKLKKNFVNILLEIYEKNYDYIFIEDGYMYNKNVKSQILENSKKIIWCLEEKNLGVKELEKTIEVYHKYEKIAPESLHIVVNHHRFNSISFSILKNIFVNSNSIFSFNFKKEKCGKRKIGNNKKIKNILEI